METELTLWEQKRYLKKESNRIAIGLILYFLLMVVYTFVNAAIGMIKLVVQNGGNITDEMITTFTSQITESGLGYLVAIVFGVLFLSLFYRKLSRPSIFKSEGKMNFKIFMALLCVFMSVQVVFTAAAYALEHLFNLTGFSLLGEIDAASAGSKTITMFLYASIFGPISEELIFRGFILKSLKKHGKVLAIVVSAVLFGAYHGNFVQSIFAVFIGLVLGYVAMEYSLWWSVALHIFNNAIFGDLLTYALSPLGTQVQSTIIVGTNLLFFLAAIVILLLKRHAISSYIKENKTHGYRAVFTSVGIIIFFALMLAEAILGIQKL